jgi:hypothetical protein
MYMKRLLVFVGMLCLSACSAGYHKMNWLDNGYADYALSKQLIKIEFAGNILNSHKKFEIYSWYRAAELCRQQSKQYFSAYQTVADAIQGKKSHFVTVDYTIYHRPVSTLYVICSEKYSEGDFSVKDVDRLYHQGHA